MSRACIRFGMFMALMLSLSSPCVAENLLLAELIVGPERPAASKGATARGQREQAGGYVRDSSSVPVIGPEDLEPGFLSPRGGAPAEERAYEGRAKARTYQQGSGTPSPVVTMPADPGTVSSDLRGRAKAYTGTGNIRDIDLSNVGRDGIPIVPCHEVDNVSGRIGDDTASGAIVYLVRQGNQIKVRCK